VRFVVPGRTIHAGPNPRYFSIGRSITYYNLMADQFTGLNAVIVQAKLGHTMLTAAGTKGVMVGRAMVSSKV
jgi:hypothetical protein